VGLEGYRLSRFCSDECISNADEFHALHKIPEHVNAEDVESMIDEFTKIFENGSAHNGDESQSNRLNNMNAAMSLKRLLLQKKSREDDKVPPQRGTSDFIYIDNIKGPYVAFLGTGSAEPSKYRGPSAIYFEMKDSKNQIQCFLMDCGEGTFGQLIRIFGYRRALERLKQMQFIWISHRHADHMSGLVEMLCKRPKDSKRLLIVGPMAAIRWIASVKSKLGIENFTLEHTCRHLNPGTLVHTFLNDVYGAQVKFLQVHHCSDSYAIVIRLRDGFKLVYSGDTEPCEKLVIYGKNADLLIHEATFEPDMVSDARRKKHSTVQEALHVSSRMSAKHTILTHFSQRYPKFPVGIPVDPQKPVGVAFDGMVVPLAILDKVSAVTTMVAKVFIN
jgi:ribonuclease Z